MCALEFQINYTLEWNEKKIDCSYKKKERALFIINNRYNSNSYQKRYSQVCFINIPERELLKVYFYFNLKLIAT